MKKNLTKYDTIIVSVKDSIQKISVAQKAPAMALKIPYNTVGFTFGYVQKNWEYNIPSDAHLLDHEIWDNRKKMHGFQVGLRIELCAALKGMRCNPEYNEKIFCILDELMDGKNKNTGRQC